MAAALIFVCSILPAQTKAPVRVAFLSIENRSGDPRYDYLSGIIQGILLYDLASTSGLEVVERSQLDQVLREQELRLGGLAEDRDRALQVGKILGADTLLAGGYVFLGAEVLLTATLIEVVNARTAAFSERGSGENMIHALAEKLIQKLTGASPTLQSSQSNRSILSLRDETPGSIALHSHLIDAEIFLDGEFAGYTTGDERVPFLLEGTAAGQHTLRLRLSGFGVIKLPEVDFRDWEEKVEVKPGKRLVVRAGARFFNEILYTLSRLLDQDVRLEASKGERVEKSHEASFTDREGRLIPITLKLTASPAQDGYTVTAALSYENQAHPFTLKARKGESQELKEKVGKVELELDLDCRYPQEVKIEYSLSRTDIWQNMWR